MALIIRPIHADEYVAVGDLSVRSFLTIYDTLDDYEAELRDVATRTASADVLVATLDGRLAGTVTYVPRPGPYAEGNEPDAAWIRMLAVDPDDMRIGVGSALVRACMDRARAAGRRRVVLHTTDAMDAAQRLYERLGFRRAEELDSEPEPGFWLRGYVYELEGQVSAGDV